MQKITIQAAFLQPVVVSLAFGVFMAFFVTLFMVPALYAIGIDFHDWKEPTKAKLFGAKSDQHSPQNKSAEIKQNS